MTREHKANKVVRERVKAALEAKLSPDELTEKENEIWLDEFFEKTSTLTPAAKAFYEDRRRLGLGVGLDKDGNLVRGSDLRARAIAALDGIIAPSDLTELEYEVWIDLFEKKLETPTADAEEFFAELRERDADRVSGEVRSQHIGGLDRSFRHKRDLVR